MCQYNVCREAEEQVFGHPPACCVFYAAQLKEFQHGKTSGNSCMGVCTPYRRCGQSLRPQCKIRQRGSHSERSISKQVAFALGAVAEAQPAQRTFDFNPKDIWYANNRKSITAMLYNIVDTLIVGQFIGKEALAAVGAAYALMTFLTSIMIGLCMGSGGYYYR